jgi:hypothetical protein
MKSPLFLLAFLSLFVLPGVARAEEAPSRPLFEVVYEHYEAVRQALVADRLEGISGHGAQIAAALRPLRGAVRPAELGVPAGSIADLQDLLPELRSAAEDLAEATTLEEAREAFYDLSKPLVRYWKLVPDDERGVVAYCSMAKKAWLQPPGELGNPYYGESMDTCGEVVSP